MRITIVYTRESDGKVNASVPSLPGCYAWGRNFKEARRTVMDAIELVLEALEKSGEVPAAEEFKAETVEA
jgi:predicted RNase H-like HicB family nuclease